MRLFRALCPGLLLVLALAAGCLPVPGQTSGGSASSATSATTAEPSATAAVTGTIPVTATTALGPTPEVSTSLPPGATAPPPAEATPVEGRSIILEDNGKIITLQAGERFLLNLGEGYDWEVMIEDQNVVSRVMGVLTIRGSQGLFEARQPGATMLTANGNPTCLSQQPPCKMPSRTFQVRILVTPATS